jgi:hypothetical protein
MQERTITYTFTEDEWCEIESLLNDAIFANRKRLQHVQGKIDLNVPGNDSRNRVVECTEEQARQAQSVACNWYNKFSKIRDEQIPHDPNAEYVDNNPW